MSRINETHFKELIWESFRAMKKCELDYSNSATAELEGMCNLALTFNADNLIQILTTLNDIAKSNNEFELSRQIIEEILLLNKMQRMRKLFK